MESNSRNKRDPQHIGYFSNEFRYLVVNDLLCTGDSVAAVAKRYEIGRMTLYKWLSIFGVETPSKNRIKEESMSKRDKELHRELAELKRENSRLKLEKRKAEMDALYHKTLLEKVANKHNIDFKKKDQFEVIDTLRKGHNDRDRHFGISELCLLANVSRSGYYNYNRSSRYREQELSTLSGSIVYYCHYLRQKAYLPKAGGNQLYHLCKEYFGKKMSIGRDKFFDVLRINNLLLRTKKKRRAPRTTFGVVNHGFEDHVNREVKYTPTRHCRLRVSDITYLKCTEGFVYLSLTMDAYSRIITGYSLQRSLATKGPYEALKQTVSFYADHGLDVRGLIFHSDRGSQYVSKGMTLYEASLGIITSVTQTGAPLHNSMAECLNSTIKNDWLYDFELLTFEETQKALDNSISMYNTARPHSGIRMKTPMQMLVPNYPNPLISSEIGVDDQASDIHLYDAQAVPAL